MKNLKKVLALVVALTMVLGTVGFAAYTDVAEDAGEYTAVSTLSSLSILTGYEDGSFKPDGDITRAEFA
ncbi:MAG: S-layer homology domain-containing protein, partial [Clostridia bacterium]|nr:S-layer homology domain-containing protein [Clostridia bacterium]